MLSQARPWPVIADPGRCANSARTGKGPAVELLLVAVLVVVLLVIPAKFRAWRTRRGDRRR